MVEVIRQYWSQTTFLTLKTRNDDLKSKSCSYKSPHTCFMRGDNNAAAMQWVIQDKSIEWRISNKLQDRQAMILATVVMLVWHSWYPPRPQACRLANPALVTHERGRRCKQWRYNQSLIDFQCSQGDSGRSIRDSVRQLQTWWIYHTSWHAVLQLPPGQLRRLGAGKSSPVLWCAIFLMQRNNQSHCKQGLTMSRDVECNFSTMIHIICCTLHLQINRYHKKNDTLKISSNKMHTGKFFLPLRQTICCSSWLVCSRKAITSSHESHSPSAEAASRQHLWLLLSATSNLIFSHGACSSATLLMVCIWGGFLGARLFARHSAPWPSSTPSLISLFFPSVLSLSILLPILFWRRWNRVNDRKDHWTPPPPNNLLQLAKSISRFAYELHSAFLLACLDLASCI